MAMYIQKAVKRLRLKNIVEYSVEAKVDSIPEETVQFFRTLENDPKHHNEKHLHRFYTISETDKKQVFGLGGIPKILLQQMNTFTENCLLIRKPSIEIISYIREADYSRPANKYVLYGEFGTGKSTSLIHLAHYGYSTNKLLFHVPWVLNWFRFPKEISASRVRPACWDLPVDGAAWLMHFKKQNHHLLKNPDLRVTKDYDWGPHESTKVGTSFLELIDFGISRIKYSCEIILALTNEIKSASNTGICNTMVIIDGFNGLFTNYTRIKDDNKKFVPANKVTLTEALLNITKSDWCNGSIILTVDQKSQNERRDSIYPRYLLTKEGFEHLDPFIPVQTEVYNDEEYYNMIEYLKNRMWIRDISPEGILELRAICNSNPLQIREYCNSV